MKWQYLSVHIYNFVLLYCCILKYICDEALPRKNCQNSFISCTLGGSIDTEMSCINRFIHFQDGSAKRKVNYARVVIHSVVTRDIRCDVPVKGRAKQQLIN